MNGPIDVVITWVDGSDTKWKEEFNKYSGSAFSSGEYTNGEGRYSDNQLLKYIFRGIETYMPWVRKIHLVTCGHYPKWINFECEKLSFVKHSDFIPLEYLPTFNSNTILLNLHRIDDLSDNFILFNDDTFVLNKCPETLFFKNNKPVDMAVMEPVCATNADPFWDMLLNNLMVVNRNFDKKKIIRKHFFKWFTLNIGFKGLVKNVCCSVYNYFPGFYDPHNAYPLTRKYYEELWNKEFDICNKTCLNKFRTSEDITDWTVKYFQFASGYFYPINKNKYSIYTTLKDDSSEIVFDNKYCLACLNDNCDNDKIKRYVAFFETKFPNKSKYEL